MCCCYSIYLSEVDFSHQICTWHLLSTENLSKISDDSKDMNATRSPNSPRFDITNNLIRAMQRAALLSHAGCITTQVHSMFLQCDAWDLEQRKAGCVRLLNFFASMFLRNRTLYVHQKSVVVFYRLIWDRIEKKQQYYKF